MLTRRQIAAEAQRQGLPLHVIDRDYVQHLFLRNAAKAPLAFKGGTCLRVAYGSPRYSEDLDFDADEGEAALAQLVAAAERLSDYGVRAEVLRRASREVLHARLRFEGPLFDGSPLSRGSIRIEVSLRQESVETEEVFVPRTPYPDVPQLLLRALTKEHLLAEKVRALLVRHKARDLYDIHFLLSRGFRCSRSLLDRKMRLYRQKFSLASFDRGAGAASRTWDRDLSLLLGQAPPSAPVLREVRAQLRTMLSSGG